MKLDSVPSPFKGLTVSKNNSLKSNSSSYINSPEVHPEEIRPKLRSGKHFDTMRMQSGFLEGIKRGKKHSIIVI